MKQALKTTFMCIPVVLLVCGSGCTAVSAPQGETTVYTNSIPFVGGLSLIGAGFLFFGVMIAKESLQNPRASRRRSKRKKRSGRKRARPRQSGSFWGVVVGGGLTTIGLIILCMGVPSSLIAYVEVGPEKVVIRDQLFWFMTSPKELSYNSITDIDHEVVQTIARRGVRKKEYLYISHAGGMERIEMTPIHKAAREHLEQAFANFQQSGGLGLALDESPGPLPVNVDIPSEASIRTAGRSPSPATASFPSSPPQSGNLFSGVPRQDVAPVSLDPEIPDEPQSLTKIDRIGRFREGKIVMAKSDDGKSYRALIIEVYQERMITIQFEYGPDQGAKVVLPLSDCQPSAAAKVPAKGEGPGLEITDASQLNVGTKLLAYHDGDWLPASVKRIRGSRPVIQWDGERNLVGVPLSWLRIPD